MRRQPQVHDERAFAVVITLVLLSLLVGIALAISATFRSNSDLSVSKQYQTQARQNALLALKVSLSELQKAAGPDARVTGMAGIIGILSSDDSPTRYWSGVWDVDGNSIKWLVSGNAPPDNTSGILRKLVGDNTVGKETNTSSLNGTGSRETEHVIVPQVELHDNDGKVRGNMAYWVGDEGIKVSSFVPLSETPDPLGNPVLSDKFTLVSQKALRDALVGQTPELLGRFISYEQLSNLGLTPSLMREPFHYATLSARFVDGGAYVSGRININTASRPLWYSIVSTYNLLTSGAQISQVGKVARDIADSMVTGPFALVSEFATSTLLDDALPASVSPAVFVQTLDKILTTRSDTFRIRGYGDAINPSDAGVVGAAPEAVAYCEAIVQRTTADDPGGNGKKFVITYFRWLGPDDI